jgi:hypothetical protein
MTARKPNLFDTRVIWKVVRASQCGRRSALCNEGNASSLLEYTVLTEWKLWNEPTLANESSGPNWRSTPCHADALVSTTRWAGAARHNTNQH